MEHRDPKEPVCSYHELLRRQSVDAAAKAAREAERAGRRVHPDYEPECDWDDKTEVGPLADAHTPAYRATCRSCAAPLDRSTGRALKNDVNGPNPKDLVGRSKPDLSLVSGTMMGHLAAGLADGARKYGVANWRQIAVEARTYTSAAQRHIKAWEDGEELAPDSLVHHLGHAMASLGIILDALACGTLLDNRATPGASAKTFEALTASALQRLSPEKRPCTSPASCHTMQKCMGGTSCPRFGGRP